jgi:hypothetical protein
VSGGVQFSEQEARAVLRWPTGQDLP